MGDQVEGIELSEADGGFCPTAPPVWQSLQSSALEHADKIAVVSLHQPSGLYGIDNVSPKESCLRWSYAQLRTAVDRMASSLEMHGVRRGKALATFLPNGVESVIALWAAYKIGCPFVPLNPRSLINASQVTHMLRVANIAGVIVRDDQAAATFDLLSGFSESIEMKIVASEKPSTPSWGSFGSLMELERAIPITDPVSTDGQDDVITILFTSGTTSVPKGVSVTNANLNAISLTFSAGRELETSILCMALPNNHAYAYSYVLHFMRHGGTIVFPSPQFDATAMVEALEAEKITHTALVPTMLHALLEALRVRGKPLNLSLTDVCLSGGPVSPENVRQVKYELKSRGVSCRYGMTEGQLTWIAPRQNPEDLIYGDLTIAGPPAPGAYIRICALGSRVPVPRGERGEIHQSGPGLVKAYLGTEVGLNSFYNDERGQTWFITGDQGIMLPDGRVCLTGRYKEMIIRGGENIAPAAIEAVLTKACGTEVQVVGVPDLIAGEVPVAILQNMRGTTAKTLQEIVSQQMGPSYVPDQIITVETLGLIEFPKTISGKVQKTRLAELVLHYRRDKGTSADTTESGKLHDAIVRAYYRSTGIPVEALDLEAPITNFADSITTMRVRDYLYKDLGWAMSVQQMVDYPNISSQIRLLQKLNAHEGRKSRKSQVLPAASDPPTIDEMSIMFGSLEQAKEMSALIHKTLKGKGFDFQKDVASIIPAHDFMQVLLESGIINTWHFGIAILTNGSTKEQLRNALEQALSNNPLMISFYVTDRYQRLYYITLKPSAQLLDRCIIDHDSVKMSKDVQQLAMEYPFPRHGQAPGPLFRCLVVHVEETNSAAMVMYLHHLVHDACSMRLFFEDLDSSLLNPTKPLRPHIDFKAWADSYQALRDSPAATASVDYHVRRLAGLTKYKDALYPPAPLPRQGATEVPDGLDHAFDCPDLLSLKQSHPDITAALVLKAAIALVNVSRTGSTHALFNNFEAARVRFPFVPASLESRHPALFEAADVNGPVMETVTNVIHVPRSETALAFLARLQTEQLELTKHAHAPLCRVIDALNACSVSDAGDMIVETHRTQFVTWLAGFPGEYERITIAQLAIRCAQGLVVVASLGGPRATTYGLTMRWDVANYSRAKTGAFVRDLEAAVLWLTKAGNWEQPVGGFSEGLAQREEVG